MSYHMYYRYQQGSQLIPSSQLTMDHVVFNSLAGLSEFVHMVEPRSRRWGECKSLHAVTSSTSVGQSELQSQPTSKDGETGCIS